MDVVSRLLARESPLYCKVAAEVRRGKELCEQWADWWDAFQFTPREDCVPEPELFWIAHPPYMRPLRQGHVPSYVSRVRVGVHLLRHKLDELYPTRMELDQDATAFSRHLGVSKELAAGVSSMGDSLNWPFMRYLGTELRSMVAELEWEYTGVRE